MGPVADVSTMPDAELDELLARLSAEERVLSRRRTALHQRIDFVRAGGSAYTGAGAEQLAALQDEERRVSAERHALHGTLQRVRAESERRIADRRAG